VTSIGDQAFSGNTLLKTISVSDGLKSLGANVFERNYSLTSILYCGKITGFPITPTCPPERQAVIDAAKATADKVIADAKAAAELKAKQEAEAKAAADKVIADAKAAAELKAKQEAEAKASAELKAKQEAELKAAAELKAKKDAEEAAAKVAAELKAKQEAEAKAAELKKTTITCIKGKLTKKVTAVNPKCPSGYKKK